MGRGCLLMTTKKGANPLHYAAATNQHQCIAFLLQSADAKSASNGMDAGKNNPAHVAAEHGYVESFKLLTEAGANIDVKNKKGHTPRGLALGHESTAAYIRSRDNPAAVAPPAFAEQQPPPIQPYEQPQVEVAPQPTHMPVVEPQAQNYEQPPIYHEPPRQQVHNPPAPLYDDIHGGAPVVQPVVENRESVNQVVQPRYTEEKRMAEIEVQTALAGLGNTIRIAPRYPPGEYRDYVDDYDDVEPYARNRSPARDYSPPPRDYSPPPKRRYSPPPRPKHERGRLPQARPRNYEPPNRKPNPSPVARPRPQLRRSPSPSSSEEYSSESDHDVEVVRSDALADVRPEESGVDYETISLNVQERLRFWESADPIAVGSRGFYGADYDEREERGRGRRSGGGGGRKR